MTIKKEFNIPQGLNEDTIVRTKKGKEFTIGEIQNSNRIQKSATPKQDLSWYIKWVASCFILASMSMRGIDGLQLIDLVLSLIGVTGWMIVGILWKDRALMLLNGVGIILFTRTLFQDYLGPLL
jgi:hypothetical protein